MTGSTTCTRFAPSPTGELHLGGAWTALASWIVARSAGGRFLLRVEDLDTARVDAFHEQAIARDLAWLGLNWDGEPVKQSERSALYEEAMGMLATKGLLYACDCSRAEIARAVAAPHPGDEVVYPGFCRRRDPSRVMRRPPATRVVVPNEVVRYEDGGIGTVAQRLDCDVGDFVLKRGDGAFAYQLAVVVDDLATGITDVVRGADLVVCTPRQIWLARALGGSPPRYTHVPMVVGKNGARLEKRAAGVTIRALREAGVSAEQIVGRLAHGLGLRQSASPTNPAKLAEDWAGGSIAFTKESWPVPMDWQALAQGS